MPDNKKNLCILPWISLDRNADTSTPSFAPCCLYQGEKQYHGFEEYWNSDELKKLRHDMLEDQKPKGCWKCWNDEDRGKKSMRQSVNESRLRPHIAVTSMANSEIEPLQIKLQAGASCNLAHKVWQEIGMETLEQRRYDDVSDHLIRDNARRTHHHLRDNQRHDTR